MSITQTVYIPASHRLTIDVPREIPAGRSILTFTLTADTRSVDQRSNEPKGKAVPENSRTYRDLLGCCKGQPGSVDDFLADCRADKERELAIEKRQEEERKRRA